jgi:hypothetical protein
MKVFVTKSVATGILIILCCGFWGCSDPDKRLSGAWELYEYKDGFRTESESSLLTITSEDEFVLDSPGSLIGIVGFRYTTTGSYKTERGASPAMITFQYDVLGADVTNVGIYRLEGFWNPTLYLALNYELGDDAEAALNKTGGPVLVGQKLPDSKKWLSMTALFKRMRCLPLIN